VRYEPIVTTTEIHPTHSSSAPANAALAAPSWIAPWVGKADRIVRTASGLEMSVASSTHAMLVTAVACKARVSNGEAFRARTMDAYRAVWDAINQSQATHIVRMWNHIPGIHDPLDAECDRYMHFNAGRFAAMYEWFGGADRIPESVPAASGVGHDGQDLIIRALALREPGVPIENPRQVPAFRYSKRYGPIPPCFARATRIESPLRALLIAGTAAITGEQSQHLGDLDRQLELTLENIRILIRAGAPQFDSALDPLQMMNFVRVYVARSQDIAAMQAALSTGVFGASSDNIEFLRADLCRTDLLVEIEGVARLNGA
jgi:chorismate lyase / 3-hydroxybenzoate synthase